MADVFSKKKRSTIMARIRGKHTAPEKALKRLLRISGIRYRSHDSRLPGTPDFVLLQSKAAIFINGCFWHGHIDCRRSKLPSTNIAFWKYKIRGNIRRDKSQRNALRREGWKVLTFWTCRRPERFMNRLVRTLSNVP